MPHPATGEGEPNENEPRPSESHGHLLGGSDASRRRIGHEGLEFYRLTDNPPEDDEEDLVHYWLWSDRARVFSHETAHAWHGPVPITTAARTVTTAPPPELEPSIAQGSGSPVVGAACYDCSLIRFLHRAFVACLSQPEQVIALARQQGVIWARDLDPLGIPRTVLQRLVEKGELIRTGRGLYMSPNAEITPHHTLVEVAARVPDGAVNLLSALAFHELTDEVPAAVWIAIRQGSQAPRLDFARLEVTWTCAE